MVLFCFDFFFSICPSLSLALTLLFFHSFSFRCMVFFCTFVLMVERLPTFFKRRNNKFDICRVSELLSIDNVQCYCLRDQIVERNWLCTYAKHNRQKEQGKKIAHTAAKPSAGSMRCRWPDVEIKIMVSLRLVGC